MIAAPRWAAALSSLLTSCCCASHPSLKRAQASYPELFLYLPSCCPSSLIWFYLYCYFALSLSLLSGSSSFLCFTFSLHISVRLHRFLYLSLSVFITWTIALSVALSMAECNTRPLSPLRLSIHLCLWTSSFATLYLLLFLPFQPLVQSFVSSLNFPLLLTLFNFSILSSSFLADEHNGTWMLMASLWCAALSGLSVRAYECV